MFLDVEQITLSEQRQSLNRRGQLNADNGGDIYYRYEIWYGDKGADIHQDLGAHRFQNWYVIVPSVRGDPASRGVLKPFNAFSAGASFANAQNPAFLYLNKRFDIQQAPQPGAAQDTRPLRRTYSRVSNMATTRTRRRTCCKVSSTFSSEALLAQLLLQLELENLTPD